MGSKAIPRIVQWTQSVYSHDSGSTIVVDIPSNYKGSTFHMLQHLKLPNLVTIDRPSTSLGSSKEQRRSTIRIHLNKTNEGNLEELIVVKWLMRELSCFEAVVGWQASMAERGAKLVETNSSQAALHFQPLCESVLILSPRLLLVISTEAPGRWKDHLGEVWRKDPANGAISIRLRASESSGNSLLAQIPATKAQIAACRARRGKGQVQPDEARPETLRVSLSVPLGTVGPSHLWLPEFMNKVAGNIGIPLAQAGGPEGLSTHEWRAQETLHGTWSGQVVIQLASTEELLSLNSSLHGKGIDIQGQSAALGIDSKYIDLGVYR